MMTTKTLPQSSSTRPYIVAILGISLAATLFLFWLIYVHPAADTASVKLTFLPALNAFLNGLSACALLFGFTFIRTRHIAAHRASMVTAFIFSSLFLVSYIVHHALHGDVRYPVGAAFRTLYLWLLGTHIILAIVCLPMILITFFFSLTGRFPMHKKIARWTFPIWLYVSVTGVVNYLMLANAR